MFENSEIVELVCRHLARLVRDDHAGGRRGDRRPEAQGTQLDYLSDDHQRLGLQHGTVALCGVGWTVVQLARHGGRPGPVDCRLYAIGGMGAGDVKLLAGVGAWMWGP